MPLRNRIGLLTALASSVLLLPAQAQEAAPGSTKPLPEVAVAYDAIGSNAPAGQCGCFFLDGASVTGAFPIPHRLSVVGQISGSHASNIGGPKYDLTLVYYLGGLRYTLPLKSKHISLFAQGLIGGSHASGSLVGSPNPGAENAGQTVAGSVGGGVDLHWKRAVSIRVLEVDYQPTTFNNHQTALENNYRLSAGLVFHMGKH